MINSRYLICLLRWIIIVRFRVQQKFTVSTHSRIVFFLTKNCHSCMLSPFDKTTKRILVVHFVTLNRAFCILETQWIPKYSEKKQSIIAALSTYDTI